MSRVMVVTPTYNEADNIPLRAEQLFGMNIPDLDFLIVDDNSPDGTFAVAEQLKATYGDRLHTMCRTTNRGFGPSYLDGFQYALEHGADVVVQMDADGSHQPRYLPEILAKMADHDVVIGSRYTDGGSVEERWGWWRKALSAWANRIYVPTILGVPIKDATGGYRAWSRHALEQVLDFDIRSTGYVIQIEMIYIAHKLGNRIAEVPIHFPDRDLGASKMSRRNMFEAALRTWQIRSRYNGLGNR